jgi:hypothetical protein
MDISAICSQIYSEYLEQKADQKHSGKGVAKEIADIKKKKRSNG